MANDRTLVLDDGHTVVATYLGRERWSLAERHDKTDRTVELDAPATASDPALISLYLGAYRAGKRAELELQTAAAKRARAHTDPPATVSSVPARCALLAAAVLFVDVIAVAQFLPCHGECPVLPIGAVLAGYVLPLGFLLVSFVAAYRHGNARRHPGG